MSGQALATGTSNETVVRVLVTGATGAVGPTVVAALHAAGYTVRILVRQLPNSPQVAHNLEYTVGDITDPVAVSTAAMGCAAAVHMAALLHINNPASTLRHQYQAINVEGTANLLTAAQQHGLQRVVFFSTIAVYGNGTDQPLDEASTPIPASLYGETKLAAERLVLAAHRRDGVPLGVVLRLAAVYGARVKGNYARLLASLRSGRFLPLGQGNNRRTLVHEYDVATAALLALRHPAAAGQIYNVTDGSYHTIHEIITTICQALGRHPPRFRLPLRPVRVAAGLLEDGLRYCGYTAPIGRATVDKYSEEMIVNGSRIQRELGFVPQYDLATGWHIVVEQS